MVPLKQRDKYNIHVYLQRNNCVITEMSTEIAGDLLISFAN